MLLVTSELSGDRMSELTDFMDDFFPMTTRGEVTLKNNLKCRHDIIAEWCATCKRMDTPSIKQVLLQENLAIVENLLSWPTKSGNHITSR
jgi:hypothetical protein